MTKSEAEWMLAVAREIFGRSEPRPEALEMLDRGEIPAEREEDDHDVHG